jgi:hypothetical protein
MGDELTSRGERRWKQAMENMFFLPAIFSLQIELSIL